MLAVPYVLDMTTVSSSKTERNNYFEKKSVDRKENEKREVTSGRKRAALIINPTNQPARQPGHNPLLDRKTLFYWAILPCGDVDGATDPLASTNQTHIEGPRGVAVQGHVCIPLQIFSPK